MKKLRKITRMRDDAWGWLSKYIRLKDADPDGFTTCYTCDKKVFYKEIHCGHFKHGHNKPTFLLEDNVKSQCCTCNLYKSGVLDVYATRLVKDTSIEFLEELETMSHQVVKLDRDYYQLKIDTYKAFYESLVRQRLEKGYTV